MRIKVLGKSIFASGKPLEANREHEVSDQDGRILIAMGKAVEAEAKPAKRRAKADASE